MVKKVRFLMFFGPFLVKISALIYSAACLAQKMKKERRRDHRKYLEAKAFDFADFSELVKTALPNIEELEVRYMLIKNFRIENLPKLKKLSLKSAKLIVYDKEMEEDLENPVIKKADDPEDFKIVSRTLTHLTLENIPRLDALELSESIKNCPKIEEFVSQNLGVQRPSENQVDDAMNPKMDNSEMPFFMYPLYFPSAGVLNFEKVDFGMQLQVFAPVLKKIDIEFSKSLRKIEFLTENLAKAEIKDAEQSEFTISCTGTDLSAHNLNFLAESKRVKNRSTLSCAGSQQEADSMEVFRQQVAAMEAELTRLFYNPTQGCQKKKKPQIEPKNVKKSRNTKKSC